MNAPPHPLINTWITINSTRPILLKIVFQRILIIKLHPRDAPNEALPHGLVLPDVQIFDIVKLRIRRVLDVKMVNFWLEIVHFHY